MDSGIGRSIDRISNLSDTILCRIISFLPTKYAVGTSILSKRWQYLWASVPNLDFDDALYFDQSKLINPTNEAITMFTNFVDRVLLLCVAPHFQTFRVVVSNIDDYSLALLNTWICAMIKRNVPRMELRFKMDFSVKLPRVLFNSKILVVLILERGVLLQVPASVWLPSLRILHLESLIDNRDEHSAQKLFSGCPVLEELHLMRWTRDGRRVMEVSIPSLKHLRVEGEVEGDFVYEPVDESDFQYTLVINAPKLEHLYLDDFLAQDVLVDNLPSLLKARVNVEGCIKKLISGITNVEFLYLSASTLSVFPDVNDYVLPIFHNLIRLKLGANGDSGWNLLTYFLECSPNLEVLILHQGPSLIDSAEDWSPPHRVPNCLLLHLKEIEINEFNGKEHELGAIEYVLKNAAVLKKMTIDCRSPNLKEEGCVLKKLTGFPRGSKACQLDLRF